MFAPRRTISEACNVSARLLNLTLLINRALMRSEEHTSELQSPCNLVCRLLLEKKKNNRFNSHTTIECTIISMIVRRFRLTKHINNSTCWSDNNRQLDECKSNRIFISRVNDDVI